ncbi:MAG: hypothetical protein NW216_05070 [Hyphomicrobium sp.]|nr:hypothetical protein [Hyphomicrobium sp.]
MIRAATLAALLSAGLTFPALAAEADATADAANTATTFLAEQAHQAEANKVRALLASRGYTQVVNLNRDADGRWTGSGMKDGKPAYVSLVVPVATGTAATN